MESGQPGVANITPGEDRIKMYEYIHNNASTVFTYIINTSLCYNTDDLVQVELSPLGERDAYS